MYIVERNRGIRRPFHSPFLFTIIFTLCTSVCVLFATTNYKESTKFNTEYDEDKWSYPMEDDVTETVTFTNNLSPKEYLHKTSLNDISIYAIFGYFFFGTLFLVITCVLYKCCPKMLHRFNAIYRVRNEPVVNFDGDGVRIPHLDWNDINRINHI